MTIVIAPLQKALASLSTGVTRAMKNPHDLEVRDGCIQRFEYTYELAVKLLKRYIQEGSVTVENVDQIVFKDLIRIAHEMGLLQEVTVWFGFREARNNTSHAYDELKAEAVFREIPHFLVHVQFLVDQLEKRVGH